MDDQSRALLGADDPAPVQEVNQGGTAPVLLTCDHASRAIPRALDELGLDESALARHIAWDIGAAEVTRRLARSLDAPAILAGFSRLVIDLNRQPGSESSAPEVSDGVAIPGNRDLDPAALARRQQSIFEPYHAAVTRRLDAMLAAGRAPVVLAMHSFTPVMAGFERPWEIGILWNWDARLPAPLIARLRAVGLTVGDNEPYSGRGVHGYSQQAHIDARGLAGALIEIRQDLIDTHKGVEKWAGLLHDVLAELLHDPALFRVDHEAGRAPGSSGEDPRHG